MTADPEDLHALLERAYREAVENSIWKPASVDEEPEVVLRNWAIIQVGVENRHVVGDTGWEGRISSRIVSLDPAIRMALTRSGRVYVLRGPPGETPDSRWVRSEWLRRLGDPPTRDVTEEYDLGSDAAPHDHAQTRAIRAKAQLVRAAGGLVTAAELQQGLGLSDLSELLELPGGYPLCQVTTEGPLRGLAAVLGGLDKDPWIRLMVLLRPSEHHSGMNALTALQDGDVGQAVAIVSSYRRSGDEASGDARDQRR